MKIVLGICEDPAENERTLSFLESLGLFQASLTLIYVLERLGTVNSVVGGTDFLNSALGESFWENRVDEGRAALNKARAFVIERGGRCEMELLEGSPSNELISYSDRAEAELLVVGSSDKGSIESVLIGSVGRKVLIGASCSVLVVKTAAKKKSQLRAVLASDHSAYANSCFRLLNQYPRLKLSEILLLNVINKKTVSYFAKSGIFKEETPPAAIREYFVQENSRLIKDLAAVDTIFRAEVQVGDVHESINQAMMAEKADLLIMAAQGHGFLERLGIGSVSLKQVMIQEKPVLVLRMRKRA